MSSFKVEGEKVLREERKEVASMLVTQAYILRKDVNNPGMKYTEMEGGNK